MNTERDPDVLRRTILIGTVCASIALVLLGVAWPVAVAAGVGGFFVSRSAGRRATAALAQPDPSERSDAVPDGAEAEDDGHP